MSRVDLCWLLSVQAVQKVLFDACFLGMRPIPAILKLNPRLAARESIGGIPEYTPADIAAALAGLDRLAYLLGLAAINRQYEVLPEAERLLWLRLVDVAIEQRWLIVVGTSHTRHMAQMAINEYLDPPRCRKCHGKGHIYPPRSAVKECDVCEGTGNGKIDLKTRAYWMHMRWQTYRDIWQHRYERHALGIVRDCESEIVRHLRRRLAPEESD